MKRLFRSLLVCTPALLLYFAALPWVALRLDRWLGIVWRLPFWIEPVAAMAMLAGAALGIWSFRALTVLGDGTPNPLVPTARLVESGPFRHSRNPLMLGGWLCGASLACLLRSPSLLVLVGTVVVAGIFYVRWIEEPRLLSRFGEGWLRYVSRTPRWLPLVLAAAAILGGLPAMSREVALPTLTEPAILVQARYPAIDGGLEEALVGL